MNLMHAICRRVGIYEILQSSGHVCCTEFCPTYLLCGAADGDFQITESLVVVDYLDAKYGKDNPLTPADPQQAAQVPLQFLDDTGVLSSHLQGSRGCSVKNPHGVPYNELGCHAATEPCICTIPCLA